MTMLLSEAINLGTHTVVPMAGVLNRCALGMAANSAGIPVEYPCIRNEWPWLEVPVLSVPCGCARMYGQDAILVIAHIFDNHVMGGGGCYEKPRSLEQLVDYVRSIEPAETEQSSASIFDREEVAAL